MTFLLFKKTSCVFVWPEYFISHLLLFIFFFLELSLTRFQSVDLNGAGLTPRIYGGNKIRGDLFSQPGMRDPRANLGLGIWGDRSYSCLLGWNVRWWRPGADRGHLSHLKDETYPRYVVSTRMVKKKGEKEEEEEKEKNFFLLLFF